MKSSYGFSLVLPVMIQISGIALLTVLPFSKLLSGKQVISDALGNAVFALLILGPMSVGLFLVAIPLAFLQIKCARSPAIQNSGILTQLSIGLLNFSIAIISIVAILAAWTVLR